MKKAIVTGANGFVGGATLRELRNHGYEVWAIGHQNHFSNVPNDPMTHKICCDLEDIKNLPQKICRDEFDLFYHFAWAGSAGVERSNTVLQLNNVQWTIDALRAAKEIGCRRFVPAGSIVEHETIAAAYTKGNRPGLGYIYGSGKLAAHAMCMSVAADLGMELVWPEITNAYGIGERSPRLVNTTIQKCIRGEIPQFTAGNQNYDFVYIDDIARAFRLIGENGKPFYEYVIGSSSARPLRQFLEEMQQAIAPGLKFSFGDVPFTGVNLPLSHFDCTETEKDTGFRAQVSFAEGCKRTWEWWHSVLTEEEKNDSEI